MILVITVNREYFVVKIFSDSLGYVKIKRAKKICALTVMRYGVVCLKHIARNILDRRNIHDLRYCRLCMPYYGLNKATQT